MQGLRKPVIPGDQLHLNVSIERKIKGFWKYKGVASGRK